jgi:tetratricopeptide (TPR) repeat protein
VSLNDALRFYQQGRLAQAEDVCRAVLRAEPDDFGATHLLGVILLRGGQAREAVERMERAVRLRPDSIEARNNLGAALRALGRGEAALACYDAAIAARPDHAESHFNRGTILRELGRAEDALNAFETASRLRPELVQAHFHAANLLRDLGRRAEAIARYDAAIALRPDHALALNNRAGLVEGAWDVALAFYDRAVAAQPDFADAHYNRGVVLREFGRPEAAVASYDKAVALKPDFTAALFNRGNALRDLDRPADALESYRSVLAVDPEHAEAWYSAGAVLAEQNDPEEALMHFARAIALKPDFMEPRYNTGICHLALGDYAQGWRGFEWRWKSRLARPLDLPGAPWLGEVPIDGQTILVHAEAGFGDMLQLCRYLPLLAGRARVVARVQRPLVRLLRTLRGVADVAAADDPLPAFDAWIPMMSLPLAFRSTLATIPADVPYLFADLERNTGWWRRLGSLPGRKVGLVWAGSPLRGLPRAEAMDRRRSITLAHYAPLAEIDGVCFVSLQKGDAAGQARVPPPGMTLHDWSDELDDFADTAALVQALDLVITVDTAVAHLAGALGKPVWILNRYDQCWRWLRGRDDSPWYPTARLFRQRAPGEWGGVIEEVVRALREWVITSPTEWERSARSAG